MRGGNKRRKNFAAGMATAIGDLTGNGREMIETAIEIMRDRLEEGAVRMKAIEFLSERLAGKAPLVIEAELTATMIGGRAPDELSDEQLQRIIAVIDRELGPDDEPAQLLPAPRVIDVESSEAPSSVLGAILSTKQEGGDQ